MLLGGIQQFPSFHQILHVYCFSCIVGEGVDGNINIEVVGIVVGNLFDCFTIMLLPYLYKSPHTAES